MLTSKLVEIIFESRRQFNCRIYHFMPRQLSLPETTKIDHHASLPLQAVYKYHNAGLLLFSIFNQRQTNYITDETFNYNITDQKRNMLSKTKQKTHMKYVTVKV